MLQTPQSSLCGGKFSQQFIKASAHFLFLFFFLLLNVCHLGCIETALSRMIFLDSKPADLFLQNTTREHTLPVGVILSLPALSAGTWPLSHVRAFV